MPDSSKNVILDSKIKEIRPRQSAALGAMAHEPMRKILDAVVNLIFIVNPDDLLEEIARIVKELFSMGQVIIWISEEKGSQRAKVTLGFVDSEELAIKSQAREYDYEERVKIRANWMSSVSMFVPAEATAAIAIDEKGPEGDLDEVRIRDDLYRWRDGDYLKISFKSQDGRQTGALEVRQPSDGMMPSLETVRALEIFASICSVAIDLSKLREKEMAIADAAERRSGQISQVLNFATDVLALENPESVLENVLKIIRDLFGFQEATISLLDEKDNYFRYVAVMGYDQEKVDYAKTLRIPVDAHRQYILPEHLIGRGAYYLPAEQLSDDNLIWEIYTPESFAQLKAEKRMVRRFPGEWHPADSLSFVIHNRQGRVIGLLCPGKPLDGKMPTMDAIDGIGIFTSLVSIALENAKNHADNIRAKEEIELLNALLFNDVTKMNASIRECLELAMIPGERREDQVKNIKLAINILESSIDMIQKVRRMSSIRAMDSSSLLRVDLGSVLQSQIARMTQLHPNRKITVVKEDFPKNCNVLANELIGEMFTNIFSNAVKHNPSDSVEVTVAIKELKDEFNNRLYWDVSISDNGPGVPDEEKLRVFDMMRVKDSSGMKTGIGLSVSKAIVNLYGGSIWLDNKIATNHTKGTVAHIMLPAA